MSRTSSRPAATTATNPATPSSDPVSEAAPGVRTEAEVIADEQAHMEQVANSAPPGATGNPVVNATDEQLAAAKEAAARLQAEAEATQAEEDNEGDLVHYLRKSDGEVQSVNEGSTAHQILESDGEWEKTTRARAKKATSETFRRRPVKA